MRHFGAFDATGGDAGDDFLYLEFEAVGYWVELDGLGCGGRLGWFGGLGGFVEDEVIVLVPGSGNVDAAFGAGDLGGEACLAEEGAADDGGRGSVSRGGGGKFEDDVAGVVGSCGCEMACGNYLFGLAE